MKLARRPRVLGGPGFGFVPLGVVGVAAAVVACSSAPLPSPVPAQTTAAREVPPPNPSAVEPDDSAQRAWRHLVKLTKLGPRSSGSRSAERARRYLRSELKKIGAEVEERAAELNDSDTGEATPIVHVVGELAGESPEVLMLAAHYDTAFREDFEFVGANDGASGPAVLLELGRLLAQGPRHYTIWLTFIDGDAIPESKGSPLPSHAGSRTLVGQLSASNRLADIRLAVFFNQVCDAELTVARDLRSHPVFRQVFWDSASDLGSAAHFADDRLLDQPAAGHIAFLEAGMRRVVAIVDDRFGGDVPPGSFWGTEHDTRENCAAQSLGSVVSVSREALNRIAAQLRQIDHYPEQGPAPAPSQPIEGDAAGQPGKSSAPSSQDAPQASSNNRVSPKI